MGKGVLASTHYPKQKISIQHSKVILDFNKLKRASKTHKPPINTNKERKA